MKVDFIFDFASPNAYCCHKVIPEIENRTGIKFNYIHCLLNFFLIHLLDQPAPHWLISDSLTQDHLCDQQSLASVLMNVDYCFQIFWLEMT